MSATKQRAAKFACSIDRKLLARVENMRASTGESRSAFVSRALAKLTDEQLSITKVRRYVEVYRDNPETADEVTSARALAVRALKTIPWHDHG